MEAGLILSSALFKGILFSFPLNKTLPVLCRHFRSELFKDFLLQVLISENVLLLAFEEQFSAKRQKRIRFILPKSPFFSVEQNEEVITFFHFFLEIKPDGVYAVGLDFSTIFKGAADLLRLCTVRTDKAIPR